MKIILGNLLIFITSLSFATTTANVGQTNFHYGDNIVLTITSNGDNVGFLKINDIVGNPVFNTSSSKSISIINGKKSQTISRSYTFKPSGSMIIPAFNIRVDGKIETTKPIKLTMLKPVQNKNGDDFILQIISAKKEFFAGEYLDLQVILKQKKSSGFAGDINISPLQADGLPFFNDSEFKKSQNKDYIIYTAEYRVRANKIGLVKIQPAIATLSDRAMGFGGFFNTVKNKIYSNKIKLEVLPLPDNLTIFGDFKLYAAVDKSNTKNGDAVNLSVVITGDGNIKDIEKYNLEIANTTIYSDEPIIENGVWKQVFAIIGNVDFTIPEFKLDYFDSKTNSKKTITSKKIKINTEKVVIEKIIPIKNIAKTVPKKEVVIIKKSNNWWQLLLSFILGALSIFLILMLVNKDKASKNKDLIKQVKSSNSDKKLFNLLLPLGIKSLDNILQLLEENIYKNGKNKISKKEITKLIKNIKI